MSAAGKSVFVFGIYLLLLGLTLLIAPKVLLVTMFISGFSAASRRAAHPPIYLSRGAARRRKNR